ncbi:MAG: NAD(P)-binding protein [Candidatus Gracilibacteria bacterium]
MKPIILIDFSKVISPIGISRFLSQNIEQYLIIDKDKIRDIYKKNIGDLVIGKYSIFDFLNEVEKYLKQGYTKIDLEKQIYKIPLLDEHFLEFLLILKQEYKLILVSDIYKELGIELSKTLSKYFDNFIFSFEEGHKKSQKQFWEIISKKIDFDTVKLFIDDKEENISLANSFGIDGIIYISLNESKKNIFKKIFNYHENIILGAGASGILYGYFLNKHSKNDFLILEKENYSLGLMNSFKIGESYYDLGGHALHDKNNNIKEFLEKEGEINHYRQKRKAYIDYKDSYIPFPFQLHLNYLEEKEKNECIEDFFKTYTINKGKTAVNLKDYLKIKFGNGIYKYFLKEYNEKIWKTNLGEISSNFKDRIYFENIDTLLHGYLEKNEDNYGPNNYINYPMQKGYQEYLNNFHNNVKNNILNNINIKKIDVVNKLIYTDNGIYAYNNIISTIPINELIKICDLDYNINEFKYLSLQIVAILTKKVLEEKQRIYNKDKKYYFHKCVLNSNSSEFLKNKDEFIFQFENSYKNGKKIDQEKLIQNNIDFLISKGFIENKDDILKIDYKEIQYGYPIQTIKMISLKTEIIQKLNSLDIYTLGRFGNWDYINFDKVILDTIKLYNKKENENIII